MSTTMERTFQLWEYKVSHGCLLIRSPRSTAEEKNVDIVFVGVEYLAVPRFMRGIQLSVATSDELEYLGRMLGKAVSRESVWILASEGQRFPVVAVGVRVEENEGDIFDSPFK
jgi:hypothetical protein